MNAAQTAGDDDDDDELEMDSSANIEGLVLLIVIILVLFMLGGTLCWAGLWRWRKGMDKATVDLEQLEQLLDEESNEREGRAPKLEKAGFLASKIDPGTVRATQNRAWATRFERENAKAMRKIYKSRILSSL